ncbi:hypothetical protein AB0M43_30700 [Longispora sp. NPDC051575]|uniref:hypothetical protein n=1 Tax=Longispora sp. NPDC051575 TaxID=3154943 RepID=UPI00342351B2
MGFELLWGVALVVVGVLLFVRGLTAKRPLVQTTQIVLGVLAAFVGMQPLLGAFVHWTNIFD